MLDRWGSSQVGRLPLTLIDGRPWEPAIAPVLAAMGRRLRGRSGDACSVRLQGARGRWLPSFVGLGLLVVLLATVPAQAAAGAVPEHFRCEGLPLAATLHAGAVDDPSIPNRSGGTLPGAFVQLQWQRAGETIALQLPRTNNAGAPSFTDGKWWWSLEDPAHPRFRLRRGGGAVEDFACERA